MTDALRNVLGTIQGVFIWLIMLFWVYQIVISIASLFKFKEKPLLKNKKHKFMIIVPAHNESKVIRQLVESAKAINYDKELYDIYVIADNCTDNTAKIARDAGAIVYERFDETKKTKGYALNWFFKKVYEEGKRYDAIIVFDADNVIDSNFLNVMNRKLCQGEKVVQGYRDIKNPTDTWVSGGYAIYYWMMNRFYHLARYNIGLSPLLNGTAFMVEWNIIMPEGWNTSTLTEDIEFSLLNIIEGQKLGWAQDAIVYDEQPVSFKQSWTQRERWSVGHYQCFGIYTGDLAKATAKRKTVMNLDGFLYMLGMPVLFITITLLVVNTIFFLVGEMSLIALLTNYWKYLFSTFLMPMITAIIVILIEKKPLNKMWKAVVMYPVFMGSWILINIKALINPNTKWEKIEHTKGISIDEAQEIGNKKK